MGNPQKDKDKEATDTLNTFVFDHNDVRIQSFFLEGEPEGKELEVIEEDKLLEIHKAFQQKLKEKGVTLTGLCLFDDLTFVRSFVFCHK